MRLFIYIFFMSSVLFGTTLKNTITDALHNNPVVAERLKNFRATQQDLGIAESEYYPSLDFRASIGYTDAGTLNDDVKDVDYTNYETSLKLTQNIFDGFSTTSKVNYQEARMLAAAYNYMEKANDIAFRMTSAYVNVMKAHELLEISTENVKITEDIYKKVKDLFSAGMSTDSEVKKIQSALSLAQSNLIVQKNNTKDTEYNYRRILGRMPEYSKMEKPTFEFAMPESIERAAMYAIEHNPSLLVSRYNIKGAQALWNQTKKEYYPRVDFEVSQNYNDASISNNGFNQADDRFTARIVLNYNLFRGGADKANIQKQISKVNQEIEIKRDLKRQVIEGLDLSWNAYEMIRLQIKDLKKYRKYSVTTLRLYKEEYDLGRRSLLDLLSAQNDVINAKSQIVTAKYDNLFAKYRILDAMGLLVEALVGDTKELSSKVNLYSDESSEILDTIPVVLDVDNDNIADDLDLCDNSLKENNIMPYGCKRVGFDADKDGIADAKDICPLTPLAVKVDMNGCALDEDEDGVKDYEDKCLNTPFGYKVDTFGCSSSVTLQVNFSRNSTVIPSSSDKDIAKLTKFLKSNKDYNVLVIGHTNSRGSAKYNLKLSKKRAKAIRNVIVATGINAKRVSYEGRGESEPLYDNSILEGFNANRRVEIELTKIDKEI